MAPLKQRTLDTPWSSSLMAWEPSGKSCSPPDLVTFLAWLQLLTLSAPWNEFRVREQKWGTLCSGKNWQNRFSDGQLFQESTLCAQFLYLSIYKKTLKSFRVTIVPGDYKKPSAKKKKKKIAWLHIFPFTKITNILTFPLPLWSSFSELPGCCLLGTVTSFCPK